jgi:hypothetical protein
LIELDISNFDFGVRLDYNLKKREPHVFKNLDSYVELAVSQNTFGWYDDLSDDL